MKPQIWLSLCLIVLMNCATNVQRPQGLNDETANHSRATPPPTEDLHEGRAAVQCNNPQGRTFRYVDETGKPITQCLYITSHHFNNGFVTVINRDNRQGIINREGEEVVPARFAYVHRFKKEDPEEPGFFVRCENDGLWGYYRRDAGQVLPCQFRSFARSNEDRIPLQWNNNLWGFTDMMGQTVISPQYKAAGTFEKGMAPVQDSASSLWGFIDKEGNLDVTYQYERVFSYEESTIALTAQGFSCFNRETRSTYNGGNCPADLEGLFMTDQSLALTRW